MSNQNTDSIQAIDSAILSICTACDDCYAAERAWLDDNWDDCMMWINNAIAQLESARAKIKAHHES